MELSGARVAVTGATGFLGRAIVGALLEAGAEVIGVVRRPSRGADLEARGVTLRAADLRDAEALERAFAGVDALVSNAALFSLFTLDWPAYRDTNIAGTRNVFEAAARAEVERVLHVSSIAVYRDRRGVGPVQEDAAMLEEGDRTLFNPYQVSKGMSEALAWSLARSYGQALTCVRPGPIYGPHDPNFTPTLARLFRSPLLPIPRGLCLPFVFVEDVAAAIVAALCTEGSVGQAFNTAGDGTIPMEEVAAAWAEAGGVVAPRSLWIPARAEIRIDNSRAVEHLGWCRHTLAEGFARTFTAQPELRGAQA